MKQQILFLFFAILFSINNEAINFDSKNDYDKNIIDMKNIYLSDSYIFSDSDMELENCDKKIFLSNEKDPFSLFYFFNNATLESNKCPIEGLIGNYPNLINIYIQKLKEQNTTLNTNNPLIIPNRILLYGPRGNGKTTLARKIAYLTNSELLESDGPSIVKRYVGDGAEAIENLFIKAEKNFNRAGVRTVIFIDEIDAFAADHEAEYRAEHKAATEKLWIYLDKYKDKPYIFFICATNNIEKLHKTFLDRFGANTIEIKNPDKQTIKLLIEHYSSINNLILDQHLRDNLISKVSGWNIRSIEDIFTTLQIFKKDEITTKKLWEVVNSIKKRNKINNHKFLTNEKVYYLQNMLSITLLVIQIYKIVKDDKDKIQTFTSLNPTS